ncbi:sulfurtransferase TusA family protein [uncultured Psychrobacter sp.]|uniref:sulfurtransferase TusA family protein n=1 Tax=uncultured Psychrobacter sp. TaxID=259303 RepID=UPI002639B82A|nr:sulfurtransferase TusA family protein [uncultured Psychrobacter sp.]
MSAKGNLNTTIYAPHQVCLQQSLSDTEQVKIASLLRLLPTYCINYIESTEALDHTQPVIKVKGMVDGRGLACPMPLLKTKVALRSVVSGESLYVVATDPNSQADITAFCHQSRQTNDGELLLLTVNQTTTGQETDSTLTKTSDTIFHFIITKTDSN